MKYVVVTGGSLSGIGKGTCASSIGVVLSSYGFRVTAIKIDPYLNVDAGTISPMEHGEVFVLSDGHEGDLDLGNYERALSVALTRDHNVTTGKIFKSIIQAERNGSYLGATVQIVPHVTDCIQEWLKRVAQIPVHHGTSEAPDVCMIEVGGTVGDIESSMYMEALHQLFSRLPKEDFALCHLTYIPHIGEEQKTKCAQHSFKELREAGLMCDFVFGRSQEPLSASCRKKLSIFSGVAESHVIGLPDSPSTYFVPQQLVSQDLGMLLVEKLALKKPVSFIPPPSSFTGIWTEMGRRLFTLKKAETSVAIGIVAKYIGCNDTYLSVVKAIEHAACEASIRVEMVWIQAELLEDPTDSEEHETEWAKLRACQGILVPGGFGKRGFDGKVAAVRYARETKVPYFGICLGMQTALIEGARTLLDLPTANSEEMDPDTNHKIIVFMPETVKQVMGGTMRLGNRETFFTDKDSLACKLYDGRSSVLERHRHRYEFNTQYLNQLEASGYVFSGKDESGERLEILERQDHPFFLGVQYHPEFTSRPSLPNPCFLGFILAAAKLLDQRFRKYNNKLQAGAEFFGDLLA